MTFSFKQVTKLYDDGCEKALYELLNLARGLAKEAKCHKGYKVNGFIFHTGECDSNRKTQSSGVMVKEDSKGSIMESLMILLNWIIWAIIRLLCLNACGGMWTAMAEE